MIYRNNSPDAVLAIDADRFSGCDDEYGDCFCAECGCLIRADEGDFLCRRCMNRPDVIRYYREVE